MLITRKDRRLGDKYGLTGSEFQQHTAHTRVIFIIYMRVCIVCLHKDTK